MTPTLAGARMESECLEEKARREERVDDVFKEGADDAPLMRHDPEEQVRSILAGTI